MSTATDRFNARVDAIGHSGVQPWSAGELFPGTIQRVEEYVPVLSFEEHGKQIGGWWHHPAILQERYNAYLDWTPLEHRLVRTQWLARWGAEERLCDSYEEAEQYLLTMKELDEEPWAYGRSDGIYQGELPGVLS